MLFNSRSYWLNNIMSKFGPYSNKCTFCKNDIESYSHIFWHCTYMQNIWSYVWAFVQKLDYCTKECAFFPTDAPPYITILYTYVKYYLNQCRIRNNKPCVRWFKNFMKFHLEALQYVAESSGDSERYFRCWYSTIENLNK